MLLHEELTYTIRKALFNVYNTLGFGHKEHVYQKALAKEFDDMFIVYQREPKLDVSYKGLLVGNYQPDFVIDSKVIVEIKAVPILIKAFETQLMNYLKSTQFELGLLVNFGAPKLIVRRMIWTDPRKSAINPR